MSTPPPSRPSRGSLRSLIERGREGQDVQALFARTKRPESGFASLLINGMLAAASTMSSVRALLRRLRARR